MSEENKNEKKNTNERRQKWFLYRSPRHLV